MKQQELSFIILELQNVTATLEDRLAASYKMTLLPYDMAMQGNCAPWYLTKAATNL